jgi:hypothetical protein
MAFLYFYLFIHISVCLHLPYLTSLAHIVYRLIFFHCIIDYMFVLLHV